MYIIFSEEVRKLGDEIYPWIIGSEGVDKKFAPIFKEDTPQEILDKYKKYLEV